VRLHVPNTYQKRRTAASRRERCRSCRDGTYGPVSRIWSARDGSADRREEVVIYLGRSSPTVSRGLPAPRPLDRWERRRATSAPTAVGTRRHLAFHPVGFAWPDSSPNPPVRSYRTLAPLTPTAVGAGLLSVARAIRTVPTPVGNDAVFPLGSTVPCGVRTFLTAAPRAGGARTDRRRKIDGATTRSARHSVQRRAGGGVRAGSKRGRRRKSAVAGRPSARIRSRPLPSSRRPSRCRDLRRR